MYIYLVDENAVILYMMLYDHQLFSYNPYYLHHLYNQMLIYD
jgi:hypothetical protein